MADIKSAKQRVKEKFDIAADMKGNKIKKSISNVELVDGKINAKFEISGLPVNKTKSNSPMDSSPSYKTIPKTFDDFDSFSEYAENFLGLEDDDVMDMAKE